MGGGARGAKQQVHQHSSLVLTESGRKRGRRKKELKGNKEREREREEEEEER